MQCFLYISIGSVYHFDVMSASAENIEMLTNHYIPQGEYEIGWLCWPYFDMRLIRSVEEVQKDLA